MPVPTVLSQNGLAKAVFSSNPKQKDINSLSKFPV